MRCDQHRQHLGPPTGQERESGSRVCRVCTAPAFAGRLRCPLPSGPAERPAPRTSFRPRRPRQLCGRQLIPNGFGPNHGRLTWRSFQSRGRRLPRGCRSDSSRLSRCDWIQHGGTSIPCPATLAVCSARRPGRTGTPVPLRSDPARCRSGTWPDPSPPGCGHSHRRLLEASAEVITAGGAVVGPELPAEAGAALAGA